MWLILAVGLGIWISLTVIASVLLWYVFKSGSSYDDNDNANCVNDIHKKDQRTRGDSRRGLYLVK